ncbi:MAG: NUDIX domain-containing protein [Treponematales bacterium]
MFTFCPSCASRNITFKEDRLFHCPDCGFHYYHNTACATGCVVNAGGTGAARVMLLTRAREPARGKLDLPGGFVNPGEGALEGLRRELREETGWEPPRLPGVPDTQVFRLFASFPNTYPYRNIEYHTCDLFFTVDAPGLSASRLTLDPGEIAAVTFARPEDIDPGSLAFDSTRRAIQAYGEGESRKGIVD